MILFLLVAVATAQVIPNEWVITFDPTVTEDDMNYHYERVTDMGATVNKTFRIGDFKSYHLLFNGNWADLEKLLAGDDFVSQFEPNQLYKVEPVNTNKPKATISSFAKKIARRVKKNKRYKNLINRLLHPKFGIKAAMHRRRVDAQCKMQPEATWGIVRTSQTEPDLTGEYRYSVDGTGVTAYVVDTGVKLDHSEFLVNGASRITWGTDTADNPSTETDENGHGTHVMGTILSETYGLAKGAVGIAVKVLGASGYGTTAGVIKGIEWTYTHAMDRKALREADAGIKEVANMSLGGGYSTAMNNAVKAAVNAGIIYVVAAGNEFQDACNVSPASSPDAITVGCSDSGDDLCYFSNWGSCMDIIAPGYSITSTWNASIYSTNTISGTSMSSPHVAGVIAKILSENNLQSVDEVKKKLMDFALDNKIELPSTVEPTTANKLLFMDCTF